VGVHEGRFNLGVTKPATGRLQRAADRALQAAGGRLQAAGGDEEMEQDLKELKIELSKNGIFTTTLEEIYNWGRKNSVWPLTFGLACCAIEMIATTMARYDLARFGAEVFRPSPRQADLIIVSGTVTKKMAPQVVRLYNQMPEPKYVIAMGACAISGGPFRDGYNVLKGIDRYIPVDVHIPGCPPRPEALIHAFMTLQKKIDEQALSGADRPRHLQKGLPSEFPVPAFGEHGLEPAQNDEVFLAEQGNPLKVIQ
jgi:NADH-quinone oxidoreductase subunit B